MRTALSQERPPEDPGERRAGVCRRIAPPRQHPVEPGERRGDLSLTEDLARQDEPAIPTEVVERIKAAQEVRERDRAMADAATA